MLSTFQGSDWHGRCTWLRKRHGNPKNCAQHYTTPRHNSSVRRCGPWQYMARWCKMLQDDVRCTCPPCPSLPRPRAKGIKPLTNASSVSTDLLPQTNRTKKWEDSIQIQRIRIVSCITCSRSFLDLTLNRSSMHIVQQFPPFISFISFSFSFLLPWCIVHNREVPSHCFTQGISFRAKMAEPSSRWSIGSIWN